MVDARNSLAYISGILQAVYEEGDLPEGAKESINEQLEEDELPHLKIE